MNKSIILGVEGLVGNHLQTVLATQGEEIRGMSFGSSGAREHMLDIRNATAVDRCVDHFQPHIIYLAAGMTHVDYCELHPEESYATNVRGVANVVRAANRIGAQIIFFSSDYIFSGHEGPYTEDALPNPLSVYGTHKVLGELIVSQRASRWLIIRTTGVYGTEREGKNFIYRLCNTLRTGTMLRVPVDQVGSPTYAPNMAAVVVELVQRGAQGVFNVAGPTLVDRYAFAIEAAQAFSLNPALLQPVPTTSLAQAARRPLQAGLRLEKVQAVTTTPLLDYRAGLSLMAQEVAIWQVPK